MYIFLEQILEGWWRQMASKEDIKSIGKRRSAVRRGDYVLSCVRFMLVSSTPVAESSLFFLTWRRDVMVRLEDGWIYVTLEHSCPVERRSEAMFIIYDVLHCCIIYHWACFAAVLHWFACLQSLGSVRSLDKQKRLRETPIIAIFEKFGTYRPCYWSPSTTFHKIPLSLETCRSRVCCTRPSLNQYFCHILKCLKCVKWTNHSSLLFY